MQMVSLFSCHCIIPSHHLHNDMLKQSKLSVASFLCFNYVFLGCDQLTSWSLRWACEKPNGPTGLAQTLISHSIKTTCPILQWFFSYYQESSDLSGHGQGSSVCHCVEPILDSTCHQAGEMILLEGFPAFRSDLTIRSCTWSTIITSWVVQVEVTFI